MATVLVPRQYASDDVWREVKDALMSHFVTYQSPLVVAEGRIDYDFFSTFAVPKDGLVIVAEGWNVPTLQTDIERILTEHGRSGEVYYAGIVRPRRGMRYVYAQAPSRRS